MQVIDISKRKMERLKELPLSRGVLNTEAKMLVFPFKYGWEKRELIFKKLFHDNDEFFGNKLYTLNALMTQKEEINLPELVLPEALVTVSHELVGFALPYIPNVNLQDILDNPYEYTIEEKVQYLQEIGEILEKLKKVREYSKVSDLYLNDLHESNCILNLQTGHINIVDLDSVKIKNNLVFPSRYLNPMGIIGTTSKYVYSPNSLGASYQVDENTDLYAYIMMILQFFYGSSMISMSLSEFYLYLDYLISIGVPKEIVDIFSYISISKDNVNPYEYLEELIPFYGKMHKNTFERIRKKQNAYH